MRLIFRFAPVFVVLIKSQSQQLCIVSDGLFKTDFHKRDIFNKLAECERGTGSWERAARGVKQTLTRFVLTCAPGVA